MKTVQILYLLFAFPLLFASCNMEDKGNYDYTPRDDFFPVKIADLDFAGITIVPNEPIYYEPEFTSMDDYDRYTYCWYIFWRNPATRVLERLDIQKSRILDTIFPTIPSGMNEIYFEVRDPEYDLWCNKGGEITVEDSPIGSYGIYIMKEVNGNSEVDLYKFEDPNNVPENFPIYENILEMRLGKAFSGKPVGIEYIHDNYSWELIDEDGNSSVSTPKGVWWVLTENDIVSISADMGTIYKHFDGHFYARPDAVKPQKVSTLQGSYYYLMNNNRMYGVCTMVSNVGRFGIGADIHGEAVPSDAGMLAANAVLYYDQQREAFYYMDGYSSTLTEASSLLTAGMSNGELVVNKQVEPIKILDGGGATPSSSYMRGHMILKHKTKANTYYMARANTNGSNKSPLEWIRPIDAVADIAQSPASVMASSFIGQVIYYAKGNEVWTYADGGDVNPAPPLANRQKRVATVGAGETIVQIQPLMSYIPVPQLMQYNYRLVSVVTNTTDGKYKFYAFANIGAVDELNPDPVFVLTGNGKAAYSFVRFKYQNK